MSRLLHYLLLILLSISTSNTLAKTSSPSSPVSSNEVQLKQSNIGAYLGLGLDILSKELAAQLPEDVLVGQGIMVNGFRKDSPAPKHGVKLYDKSSTCSDLI